MKIEKGIPIPHRAKLQLPLAEMNVGDSVWIEMPKTKNKHSNIYNKAKTIGCKVTIRKENNGLRIWLTEKTKGAKVKK